MSTTTAPASSLPTVQTVDMRDERAAVIARDAGQWLRCRTRDGRKYYGVPSQAKAGLYYLANQRECTCPDAANGRHCKHSRAVAIHCERVKAQRTTHPAVTAETRRLAAQYDRIFGGDA